MAHYRHCLRRHARLAGDRKCGWEPVDFPREFSNLPQCATASESRIDDFSFRRCELTSLLSFLEGDSCQFRLSLIGGMRLCRWQLFLPLRFRLALLTSELGTTIVPLLPDRATLAFAIELLAWPPRRRVH